VNNPNEVLESDDAPRRVCIGIAGNTQLPALLALQAKGYRIWLEIIKYDDPEDYGYPYQTDYQAEKLGAYFSATTPVELLGLVAMWETRGDEWKYGQGLNGATETNIMEQLMEEAKTFDLAGNEIPDDDDD
jgi:hypothetical protein